MKSAKIAAWVVAAAASAALPAMAATVTVNAPAGTSTNVTQVFSGATTVAVNTGATGGTVRLSPHNAHTGGTTLSSGTLDVQQESQLGGSLTLLGRQAVHRRRGGTDHGAADDAGASGRETVAVGPDGEDRRRGRLSLRDGLLRRHGDHHPLRSFS